jgi:hypothetical protein
MAMLALPHRLRSFVSLDEHHPSTQGISPTFRPPSLCAFRYACGSAISESELIVFHRQIPTSPPMSLPTPAAPTGNRFAVVTETDYGAPIFIAALISSIFTFLVLIVRIAFVKWHRCGLDNLILVCAKVSLMRSPPAQTPGLLILQSRLSASASGSPFVLHTMTVLERLRSLWTRGIWLTCRRYPALIAVGPDIRSHNNALQPLVLFRKSDPPRAFAVSVQMLPPTDHPSSVHLRVQKAVVG